MKRSYPQIQDETTLVNGWTKKQGESTMTTIRDAVAEDLPQLVALVGAFHDEHSRMIGGRSRRSPAAIRAEVERFLNFEDGGYMVAVSDTGDLLGFRRWALHDGFYFTRDIYVAQEARGHGVARALIRHFERWLVENGQTIACISCTPHNAAMIALARSEGYCTLNMIEMRKDLVEDRRRPGGEVQALGLPWEVV
jgi:GNAT superfamily N-acetyltransferase